MANIMGKCPCCGNDIWTDQNYLFDYSTETLYHTECYDKALEDNEYESN